MATLKMLTFALALMCLCWTIVHGEGDVDELSRATTSFGWNLYRHLASQDPHTNVIFSPLSVYTALSMTLLGTEGETEKQLTSVLALRDGQGVHEALHAVFASFPTNPDANVTMRIANALYYNDTMVTLADAFNRALQMWYGAFPKALQTPNPESAVNDWVYGATGGKIQNFLPPGTITRDIVLVLLNAIFFQGTWKDIFNKNFTHEEGFTSGSGDVIRVPMMSRDGSYAVKNLGGGLPGRVLELPYGSDGRFSLFVILPDQGRALRDIEDRLSVQAFEEAVGNMPEATPYAVRLPKFSLRMKQCLKEVLVAMGLSHFFEDAQLRRMVAGILPDELVVDDVLHEAVIEVDEKGTKAAAVTGVFIMIKSRPPDFVANRPFLIVLRDNKAKLNLFLGRVNRPEALQEA